MKTLLFLLILDFSGSMYQKVNNKVKYVILRENVKALNQGLNDDALGTQSGILSFGLNPKKKCDDFKYETVPTKNISETVNQYLPGAFSKTPLGESLSRSVDVVIENKVKKVIIFSDGADSCNKNPCDELVKANEKLVAANYFMEIKFIGINLVKNDPRFECFRNNKLSNINISYTNIGDAFDVQEALQDAIETPTKSGNSGGITLETVKSPWGIIKVRGAPATVKFKAAPKLASVDNKGRATWYGAFNNQLKGGEYLVTASYPGTKKLPVFIYPDQEKEVLWEEFFKDPKSKLVYARSSISVMLTPNTQTLEAHRVVQPLIVEGLLEKEANANIKLPFGEWLVVPLSPPWLKDLVGQKNFTLNPESSLKVNFTQLLDLEWVKSPDPTLRWVISIEEPPKKVDVEDVAAVTISATVTTSLVATVSQPEVELKRYYIQDRVESVPVPRGSKVNWIQSSF